MRVRNLNTKTFVFDREELQLLWYFYSLLKPVFVLKEINILFSSVEPFHSSISICARTRSRFFLALQDIGDKREMVKHRNPLDSKILQSLVILIIAHWASTFRGGIIEGQIIRSKTFWYFFFLLHKNVLKVYVYVSDFLTHAIPVRAKSSLVLAFVTLSYSKARSIDIQDIHSLDSSARGRFLCIILFIWQLIPSFLRKSHSVRPQSEYGHSRREYESKCQEPLRQLQCTASCSLASS